MVDNSLDNEVKTTIDNCARCNSRHFDLEFKAFSMPIYDADDIIWNYWAMCPTLKEPILMRIVYKREVK